MVGKPINGVVLMRDYKALVTKNGKDYIAGDLQSGVSVQFKSWASSAACAALKAEDYRNLPVYITGMVDGYNNTYSIVVDTVVAVDGFTVDMFLPVKYDSEKYFAALEKITKAAVSEKGHFIVDELLFKNEEVAARFKSEFAARSHHDNCKGGLLAHTYKVVYLMTVVKQMYPSLNVRGEAIDEDFFDLLIIGSVLHDIGKIDEMEYGVYTPVSVVTHNYLGVEHVNTIKDKIIEVYGEQWYYNLVSVILQHHDKYGMPAKSLAALITYTVDMFEATMTDIQQAIENSPEDKVYYDDRHFTT